MSLDQPFSQTDQDDLPLHLFLKNGHRLFLKDPARLLRPLFDALDELHQAGKSHGAVMPDRLRVAPGGLIDVGFFKAQAGHPDLRDQPIYYPDGDGSTPEECQKRDLQALGAVLHLIVTDHAPASPGRRARLVEHREAKDWPEAFITLVDRLLDDTLPGDLPTLAQIGDALAKPGPQDMTSAHPEPETSTPTAVEAEGTTAPAEAPVEPVPEPEPPATAPLPRPAAVRLPNAMVTRDYSADLSSALGIGLPPLGRIEPIDELPAGLKLDGQLLSGTPSEAGEFEIVLRFYPSTPEAGRPAYLERGISLTINPNPQSLWKNTPSDEAGEFWKPDETTEVLADSDGPLAVLGASLRGRSHAHVGSFRDDDMAMAWFPREQWYSLTVADGAGSAKFSRRGSKVVCDTVKQHLTSYFSDDIGNTLTRLVAATALAPADAAAATAVRGELYQLFGSAALMARKKVEDEAAGYGATARDYHTTLITALLHPLADGRWFVATFSIGDGAAALVSVPGGAPCLLTRPDGGDFAGQTVFLTMREALSTGEAIMSRIRMEIVPSFDALLLVTDGISDPRFDSETELADPAAWQALWEEIRGACTGSASREAAAAALVGWMGFHSPGHHDDRTLVLATSPEMFAPP